MEKFECVLSPEIQKELSAIVGDSFFDRSSETLATWSINTLDSFRTIAGVLRPQTREQVQSLVQCFLKYKLPYYPVSSGKNWGYGGATAVHDGMLILDLSRLNRIIELSSELHYVVVEPGVTQQQLFDYLKKRSLEFMVPTTGAGPEVSLIGNAVERGYGITPHEDHFGSLLAIKVLLPNGDLYSSALAELGGFSVDSVFKWKIGPYLDGLFTQSNLGIVIEGTIALAPKPKNVTQFIAFLDDENFEQGVEAVRNIKTHLSGIVGGVNLMNKRRLLSMLQVDWDRERALEEIQVIEYAKKKDLPDWAVVGAFYGTTEMVNAGKSVVKNEFKGISKKIVFLSKRKILWANRLLRLVPIKKFKQLLDNAGRALEILEGTPSQIALPLAYLKNKNGLPKNKKYNPDKDNCGLIWFAPLIPLDAPIIRDYVQELTRICLRYNIEPLITLTAFSSRCVDSTIPILFSKNNPEDVRNAKACYEALLNECRIMGLFPYRLDIDHMHLMSNSEVSAFSIAQKIKNTIDPDHLLAPGRYIK